MTFCFDFSSKLSAENNEQRINDVQIGDRQLRLRAT